MAVRMLRGAASGGRDSIHHVRLIAWSILPTEIDPERDVMNAVPTSARGSQLCYRKAEVLAKRSAQNRITPL